MIAKVTKGKGFRGLLNYLLLGKDGTPTRGQVLDSNLAGSTAREFATEFGAFRRLRPRLGVAVCHTSLSLAPEDRELSEAELVELAKHYLNEMGFAQAPYLVVRHHDTDHDHIHIVASRINAAGEVISDKQDYQRAEAIVRRLEQDYRLRQVPPSRQSPHKKRGANKPKIGGITMKRELIDIIGRALPAHTLAAFIAHLKSNGVGLLPHIQGRRVTGLVYRYKGEKLKGSELGKAYAWGAISKHYHYDPDEDFELLQALVEAEELQEESYTVENPDQSEETRRRERRQLQDDDYLSLLLTLFASRIQSYRLSSYALTLHTTGGGKIVDKGSQVTAQGLGNDDAAYFLVNIAMAKGWQSISFNGGSDFVRSAMAEAIRQGMEVVPKDTRQAQLLGEAKLAAAEDGPLEAAPPMALGRFRDGLHNTPPAVPTPTRSRPQRSGGRV